LGMYTFPSRISHLGLFLFCKTPGHLRTMNARCTTTPGLIIL
jgi:hypothetical protein